MPIVPQPRLSFQDWLAIERAATDQRSEYVGGDVFAIAGGTEEHNLIVLNVGAELRNQYVLGVYTEEELSPEERQEVERMEARDRKVSTALVFEGWDAGGKGGVLWAVSTEDGRTLAETTLRHPPAFDGMSAAAGRLFLATADGRLIAMKSRR